MSASTWTTKMMDATGITEKGIDMGICREAEVCSAALTV